MDRGGLCIVDPSATEINNSNSGDRRDEAADNDHSRSVQEGPSRSLSSYYSGTVAGMEGGGYQYIEVSLMLYVCEFAVCS